MATSRDNHHISSYRVVSVVVIVVVAVSGFVFESIRRIAHSPTPNAPALDRVRHETFSDIRALHSFAASQIVFARDAKSLLAVGNELIDHCVGLVRLSDRGNTIHRFGRHYKMVTSSALSLNEEFVLSGCVDGTVCMWNAQSGAEIRRLQAHSDRVSQVAFSPNGSIFASTGYDKTLRVFRVSDGTELHRCVTPNVEQHMLFTPDGVHILTSGWESGIRVWDAERGALTKTFGAGAGIVTCLAISNDGARVCGGGHGTVRVWGIETGILECNLADDITTIYSVAFSPSGNELIGGGRSGRLLKWTLNSPQLENSFDLHDSITSVVYSPDGSTAAICTGGAEIRQIQLKE